MLSKEAVTKALLGFATFITVEAHNGDKKAIAVYGSMGPGAPWIPALAEAFLITILVGLLTLVYFLGVRMGTKREAAKKDAATQVERVWGGGMNMLTVEGLHYELDRIGFRKDGLKNDLMFRLLTEQERRQEPSRAFLTP